MMSVHAALPVAAPTGPDLQAEPAARIEPRWRFRMIAHADPGLLPRLVAPIAKLGLVPDQCSFTLRADDMANIELVVTGLRQGQADHLRLVYAAMPAMRAVDLANCAV